MAHRSIHFEEGAVLSQNEREVNRQMIKSLTGQNVVALTDLDFTISDNKLIITSGTINVIGGSIELTDEIFEFNINETGISQYAVVTLDTSLVNEPIIEQVSDSRGDTFEIHTGILTDNVVSFSTTTVLPTEDDNINNDLGVSSFVLFECVVSNALTLNIVREPAKISTGKKYTDISDLGILYPYSISDVAIKLPEGETLISYNSSDDFLANNLPLIFYEENLSFVISFTKLQGKLIITLKSDELESLTFETIYQSPLWNKYRWIHTSGHRTLLTGVNLGDGSTFTAPSKNWIDCDVLLSVDKRTPAKANENGTILRIFDGYYATNNHISIVGNFTNWNNSSNKSVLLNRVNHTFGSNHSNVVGTGFKAIIGTYYKEVQP